MSNARTLANTINSSSQIVVPSGGVNFGTDTDGSGTVTGGILDDYEEGQTTVTATPSTSGTITLGSSTNKLYYTKVGRLVTLVGLIQPSAVSSPTGTYVTISPLPFAVATISYARSSNSTAWRSSGSSNYSDYAPMTVSEGSTSILVYTPANEWGTGPSQLLVNLSYFTS